MGTVISKTQACAISTVPKFFVERRVPQIAARVEQVSEWITMWRGCNVAEFVRSGGSRLPFWQMTPNAGTKLPVQSLPLFARCWRLVGSQAHQVSGKRQTAMPLLTALCSTKCRSSTVSPVIWKCKYGKERLGTRSVQVWRRSLPMLPIRPGLSLSESEKFHGWACIGLSCLWSHQRISPIPIICSVYVATRGPWPPGNTKCRNVPETA